jgi:hypothetical protein
VQAEAWNNRLHPDEQLIGGATGSILLLVIKPAATCCSSAARGSDCSRNAFGRLEDAQPCNSHLPASLLSPIVSGDMIS